MTNVKWKMENGSSSKPSPDRLFYLVIDCGDIALQSTHVVVLVFFGQLDVCASLVGGLAVLLGLLDGGHQLAKEIAILLKSFQVITALWPGMTESTPSMPAAAFAKVLGYSRPLPLLVASMIGVPFLANISPECITFSAGKTT